MKILTSAQIRALDAFTIANEPISSLDLMERASRAFVQWLLCKFEEGTVYAVVCGKGNNGGDGLAIARMLVERGYVVTVYVVEHREQGSADFEANLARLHEKLSPVSIASLADFKLPQEGVIIDALLGSGLNKPAEGLLAEVIASINASELPVVSVDIASGLFADRLEATAFRGENQEGVSSGSIVRPDFTVSFQVAKPAFVIPECGPYVGQWQVVDIGLHRAYLEELPADWYLTTRENLPHLLKKRGKFSHKGTFGHALLVAGSYGKMGAAVLASKACIRSGVGLLSCYVPACGFTVLQTSVPEAMALTDPGDRSVLSVPDFARYSAIGIGPGLGTEPETMDAFAKLLELFRTPMVLDADALNMLAQDPALWDLVPENTILTPHPKEFARLAGVSKNGYDALEKAQAMALKHSVIICLKGAHTAVVLPNQTVYFNSTGNPGMATGGSGDVLTGIILGLLAQGYSPEVAARLAVFKHGEAGDRGASIRSQPALIASDLVEHLRW
jgi:hydroxyethylthiazole kinase-like uncharacterized protein yjeF